VTDQISGCALIVFGSSVGLGPPPPPPPPSLVPLGAKLPVASMDCNRSGDPEPMNEVVGLPEGVVEGAIGTDATGTLVLDGTFDNVLGEMDRVGLIGVDTPVNEVLPEGILRTTGLADMLAEVESLGKLAGLPGAVVTGVTDGAGPRDPEYGGGGIEESEEDPVVGSPERVTGGELADTNEADPDGVIVTSIGGIDVGEVDDPEAGVTITLGNIDVLPDVELEPVDIGRAAPTKLSDEETEDGGAVGRELEEDETVLGKVIGTELDELLPVKLIRPTARPELEELLDEGVLTFDEDTPELVGGSVEETEEIELLELVVMMLDELDDGQPVIEEYEVAQDVSNPLLPLPKVEQDTAAETHELLLTETGGVVTVEGVDVVREELVELLLTETGGVVTLEGVNVREELVEGQPAIEEYEVPQDVSNPLSAFSKVEHDTAVETQELLLTEMGGVVTLEEELVEHGPRIDVEQVVSNCLFALGMLWYVVVQAISRLVPLIHVGVVGVGVGVIGKSGNRIGVTTGIKIGVEEVDVEQGVATTVLLHVTSWYRLRNLSGYHNVTQLV